MCMLPKDEDETVLELKLSYGLSEGMVCGHSDENRQAVVKSVGTRFQGIWR